MKNVDRHISTRHEVEGDTTSYPGSVEQKSLLKTARRCIVPMVVSSLLITACGGSEEANAPEPERPPQYQADNTGNINGLAAFYDFESRLIDASANSAAATPVGATPSDTNLGSFTYDADGGIHPLSQAVIFNGVSGLLLPRDIIARPSYSISMWVNPDFGNEGPLFFAQSERGTLLLDANGLTVSGATGFGTNGTTALTYTRDDFEVPPNTWSHIAFTVDEGLVDMYLNGERIFRGGDYVNEFMMLEDGTILTSDAFADFFSGVESTVAIGVKTPAEGESAIPFVGKIDNVRIYNEALYYGNISVLSREVTEEGPNAVVTAVVGDEGITLSWDIDLFMVETLRFIREEFSSEGNPLTPSAEPLTGISGQYTDIEAPPGGNYRYTMIATDNEGRVYRSEPGDYLRLLGTEPYAAVDASFNENTSGIDLTLHTENIDIASYDILRDTDQNIDSATLIASGVSSPTYTDARDDDFPLDDGITYFYWVQVTDGQTQDVTTSLALPTALATTSGSANILEENSVGFCGADGTIDSNHIGFGGIGFVNTFNELGTGIRWRFEIETAATYNLYIRHANGTSDQNRVGTFVANGAEAIGFVDFPPTNAFDRYREVRVEISLDAGVTDLSLIARTSDGLSNIDSLRFEAQEAGVQLPRGIPCTE